MDRTKSREGKWGNQERMERPRSTRGEVHKKQVKEGKPENGKAKEQKMWCMIQLLNEMGFHGPADAYKPKISIGNAKFPEV